MEPLFLEPVFQERIWGGTRLKDAFDYSIPSEHTGECWAISAHPNGPCKVINGPFKGRTLEELWKEERALFGNIGGEKFPLLTKILDANADLSVQVHPDDSYAKVNENGELGKTECWYVLDCKEGAQLVFGHNAKSKEELQQWIEEGKWNHLLRYVPIQKGDFFYVPSGTIHALCEGTLVLETQQNSDTTYRVYDYDRKNPDGTTRELHVEKSIDVSTVPHCTENVAPAIEQQGGYTTTTFVNNEFFTVHKWDVSGEAHFKRNNPFQLMSVIEGEGELQCGHKTFQLKKGVHFILPNECDEYTIRGNVSVIGSHV